MKVDLDILRRFNVSVQGEAIALPGPRAKRFSKLNLTRAFALRDAGLQTVPFPCIATSRAEETALRPLGRSAGQFAVAGAELNLASPRGWIGKIGGGSQGLLPF